MDIVITIPKSEDWNSWRQECRTAVENDEYLYYKIPVKPAKVEQGDLCYVVHDGYIRGFNIIEGIQTFREPFKCTTTGREWSPGNYIARSGHFFKVNPVEMKGFPGFRYVSEELENKIYSESNNWSSIQTDFFEDEVIPEEVGCRSMSNNNIFFEKFYKDRLEKQFKAYKLWLWFDYQTEMFVENRITYSEDNIFNTEEEYNKMIEFAGIIDKQIFAVADKYNISDELMDKEMHSSERHSASMDYRLDEFNQLAEHDEFQFIRNVLGNVIITYQNYTMDQPRRKKVYELKS